MKIKELVENNPLIYLLATAVGVATIAVSVAGYFCHEKMEVATQRSAFEISQLQSELASINRGLGDSKYLDIRTVIYPKYRAPTLPINPRSKYVSAGEFYAILDLPEWDYEAMASEEFNKKVLGSELPPKINTLLTGIQTYVWRAKTQLAVTYPDGTHDVLRPMILLEKTPISEFIRTFSKHFPEAAEEMAGRKLTATEVQSTKDVLPELEKLFRGDVAQLALAEQVRIHYGELYGMSDVVSTEIVQLQKIGNVLYAQFLRTAPNIEVDGKRKSVLFLREELMLISDQENLFEIKIVVPSVDPSPRGPVYTRIQQWFSGLAIPVG